MIIIGSEFECSFHRVHLVVLVSLSLLRKFENQARTKMSYNSSNIEANARQLKRSTGVRRADEITCKNHRYARAWYIRMPESNNRDFRPNGRVRRSDFDLIMSGRKIHEFTYLAHHSRLNIRCSTDLFVTQNRGVYLYTHTRMRVLKHDFGTVECWL